MKGLVMIAILAMAFVGCTKAASPGCVIESAVSSTVAVQIASSLQCSNQAAIVATIQAAAAAKGVCSAPAPIVAPVPAQTVTPVAVSAKAPKTMAKAVVSPMPLKSALGDICTQLGSTVVLSLVNGSLPAAWGCAPTAADVDLAALIAKGCTKAFP